jgi:hypothetical protein
MTRADGLLTCADEKHKTENHVSPSKRLSASMVEASISNFFRDYFDQFLLL